MNRFLVCGCCLVFLSSFLPSKFNTGLAQELTWPPEAGRLRFHMIGNAHIDPVWLWQWSEGESVVLSTFRSALDRMKESADFTFTASSAQFYEWVAETDPQMLEEIRQRVKEGRWSIVGGWWVEPDVNAPAGESLARQGLYGQALFRRLFGRIAHVGYNPDSFGHPATLPQIYKLQGMDAYVFMRPQPHEKTLPADVFWWEGPDGTRLLAFRIPISYGDWEGELPGKLLTMSRLKEPTNDLMAFYGVGDHGGGPTQVSTQSILNIAKQPGAPTLLFSTPDRYFDEIQHMTGLDLPVVQSDLEHHAVGCYTANSEIKKNNRTAETLLMTGEKFAALGAVAANVPYPKSEFTAAWKKVLFQQFHDIMAGTALPEHYPVARDAHGYAMNVANQALYRAAEKIAWEVPSVDPDSNYLVLFNPHAWNATLAAEYDLGWPPGAVGGDEKAVVHTVLEDETGAPVLHQWAQASTVIGRKKLVFRAGVPAFGYRQFRLRSAPAPEAAPLGAAKRSAGSGAQGAPGAVEQTTTVRASERELENEHLRVAFADDGSVTIYDKAAGRPVFLPGNTGARAVVLDDPSDTWSHNVSEYSKEIGAFGAAEFRVLENGPLRARVRARSNYGQSSLEVDWILYAGSQNLEARVALDWHEHLKMLKFSFPVDIENPRPTYEIPYGYIVREANGKEDPGQRWIDLSGERDGHVYGLSLINNAKYGYSVRGNDMRISVVRGAVYAQHDPHKLDPQGVYVWQDQGRQEFRMLLEPHTGTWQDAGVVRTAEEFTAPVPIIYQGIHPGHRPLTASFLAVDAPNVVVSVVKKAEEGDDLIVRCYETDGRPAATALDLALVKRRWSGKFRPFEIKTLRVPLTGGEIREVNLLEE
jgi:alpha-mannosidase